MARDPGNINIWQDARIWTALGVGPRPALPSSATVEVDEDDWFEIGILDGDAGIGEERASDEAKHYGWGLGLVKVGNKNFELNRTFTVLGGDDPTAQKILWPNSTDTALFMPKPVYRYLGFETSSDIGVAERLWTVKPALLKVSNNNRNESDITKLEVTANIFPDGTGKLFDRQVGDLNGPVAPVVSSHIPASIAVAGGELVTLTGSGFTGATAVTFGGTAATDFEVISDTKLVAIAPAKTAGSVNVVVTTPAGASAAHAVTYA